MSSSSVSSATRYHQLDGVRALACTLVVFHHSLTAAITHWVRIHQSDRLADFISSLTASGVECFFVLSGILLLRPYVRKTRQFVITNYFQRRVERLWPPYIIALLFGSLVIILIRNIPTYYEPNAIMRFSWGGLLQQLFIFKLGTMTFNGAWWSLCVEVLFYLTVPMWVYVIRIVHWSKWYSIALIICSCIVSQILHLWNVAGQNSPQQITFSFLAYLPCFIMGIVISFHDLKIQKALIFLFLGLASLVMSYLYPIIINWQIAYAFIYTSIIAASLCHPLVKSLFSNIYMIWLGERSYSLFLVHFSCFYLVNWLVSFIVNDKNIYYGIMTRCIGIPFSIFIAMIIFNYCEKYFARGLQTADSFWPWDVSRINLTVLK